MKKQKLYPRWRDKIKQQKTTKWRRKIIQNNNSEGDSGSWKQNEEDQEMFSKDLEELKNKQTETNNALEGINGRIIETEEPISDLEDRMVEISTTNRR